MVMRVGAGMAGLKAEYQERRRVAASTGAYAITVHKAQGSEYPMAIFQCFHVSEWIITSQKHFLYSSNKSRKFIILGKQTCNRTEAIPDGLHQPKRNTIVYRYRIRKIYETILEQKERIKNE